MLLTLTDTSTWQEVKAEGPKPSPRDKLQGTAIDDKIYYFGGFGPKLTGDEEDDWDDVRFHFASVVLRPCQHYKGHKG